MRSPAEIIRRAVDVLAAVTLLVVTSPILLGAAVATRVSVGSPVVYRQRRIGLGGRPFELLKFRSMRDPRPGREGPDFDAERITRVGAWLRSTSLDELPSLLNLVRGDIGLVGPRPLPVHYWPRFRGEEYERFEVPPGITGLAQVSGRNELDWPERLAIDVEYVRSRSLVGDLRILLQTVPTVLGGRGVEQQAGVTMTELPADRPDRSSRDVEPGPRASGQRNAAGQDSEDDRDSNAAGQDSSE